MPTHGTQEGSKRNTAALLHLHIHTASRLLRITNTLHVLQQILLGTRALVGNLHEDAGAGLMLGQESMPADWSRGSSCSRSLHQGLNSFRCLLFRL